MQSTVLIYGSPAHPGLGLIYESLMERSNCRALFVVQEAFFSECQLFMGGSADESMLYFTESDAVGFSDITSVCMDNFYISPAYLEGFPPEDVAYIQTEAWSTLIAMFGQLSRQALMANFTTDRDHLATRWSRLCLLGASGLPAPRALVTSDPEELAIFSDELGGEVLYKPVADPSNMFVRLGEDMAEKIERLPLAPVHFEEVPRGQFSNLLLLGPRPVHLPLDQPRPPENLVEGCQRLADAMGLTLAEFNLIRQENGRWKVADLQPFLSAASLSNPEVLASVALLLETGRS